MAELYLKDGRPAAGAARSASASHPGRVRRENQDALIERPELGLWAVADGMGGLAQGEKASRAIVDALSRIEPGDGLAERLETSIAVVNDNLRWEAMMSDDGKPMGSTIVALLIEGRRFVCLWAGDSRLYRWRGGQLHRLTRDHTPAQALIDAGLAQPGRTAQGLDHVISRAVGIEANCTLDQIDGEIEPGDLFLLCTDGLSKVVPEAAIGEILAGGMAHAAVQKLVEAALEAGGPDNVTALVVVPATPEVARTTPRPANEDIGLGEIGVAERPASHAAPAPTAKRPRRGGERPLTSGGELEWLGIVLAILAGFLGLVLVRSEMLTRSEATAVTMMPFRSDAALPDFDARLTMVAIAGLLFLIASALGRIARHWPLVILLGSATILLGLGAAVIGTTDLGNGIYRDIALKLPTLPTATAGAPANSDRSE